MAAVARAAGDMTAQATIRATRALAQRKTPEKIDIAGLIADLEALLA